MRHIPPRIGETRALRLAEKKTPLLRRLFTKRNDSNRKRIELIWSTLYLIPFDAVSRKGPSVITVSVEGWSGAFAIFEMQDMISDAPIAGEILEPRLTEAEAIAAGRAELLHTILRLPSTGSKPEPRGAGAIERLCYPFWVYYYERSRGLLDIRVIDAVTGQPAGTKIKAGILEAFRARANSTQINTDYRG